MDSSTPVAIVGLGYVGLPLAVAFGSTRPTIGLDLNATKLEALRGGWDPSGEVDAEQLAAATHLELTSSPERLREAGVILVVVPTPIDLAKRPDLAPLEATSRTVGENLTPGSIVVFESTVFPGCTEDICVPILEQYSGLAWAGREDVPRDVGVFHVGYSPERINPGDRVHRLETITKVVAGDSQATLDALAELYATVISAGVYRAPSIKVAEAAKVIENTQRDLNIALMNELAMIFDRLDIDTLEVLEAAGTKWNFLPFRPGLVGGHCIGVDPYYLTFKAQSVGYHPSVVLAGRRINDGMGKFLAAQTVKQLATHGLPITGTVVNVLGLTFKENCPDLRNSRVPDIVSELQSFGCTVNVHDPLADPEEARAEYGITLTPWESLPRAGALLLAVPHAPYVERDLAQLRALVDDDGILIDVKGTVDRGDAEALGLALWRL